MSLGARDQAVLWHPYTQAALAPHALGVVAGQGASLHLDDGRVILDAISSWWTCVHGHAHPRLAQALLHQAQTLEHVIFAGFTHEPGVALAEQLTALTGLDRVFYSDNGSTAVEVALKMAYQYWAHRGEKRTRFLTLEHAYHGDTVGAMSVSGIPLFARVFSDLLFSADVYEGSIHDDVAAVIVEPMVQGAGGMRVYPPEFLAKLAAQCRASGTLLIADEVMTGFGRTGTMFACEHAAVRPDILCLSKGLTGGTLPFAATVATDAIYQAFWSDDRARTFFHGHSYCGNPLGCAVALASLELFAEQPLLERSKTIGARIEEQLAAVDLPVRGLGCIRALDVPSRDAGYLADIGPRIAAHALERGVLLRPLGNVVYAMPPLCTTDDEADQIGAVMADAVRATA